MIPRTEEEWAEAREEAEKDAADQERLFAETHWHEHCADCGVETGDTNPFCAACGEKPAKEA